jgi:hypothetical protein
LPQERRRKPPLFFGNISVEISAIDPLQTLAVDPAGEVPCPN